MILSQEHREPAKHLAGIALAAGRGDLAIELATAGEGHLADSGRLEREADGILDNAKDFGIEHMSGKWLALNAIKAEASRVSGRRLPTGAHLRFMFSEARLMLAVVAAVIVGAVVYGLMPAAADATMAERLAPLVAGAAFLAVELKLAKRFGLGW